MTLLQVYEAHILNKIADKCNNFNFFLYAHKLSKQKRTKNCEDILLTWALKKYLKKALKKVMMLFKCLCHEALGNNFRSVTKL
jgi:hypothetical protein